MRVVAVVSGVAALIAGGASMTAAASHRATKPALQYATSPSWSPDGEQIIFTYVRYAPTTCCGLQPSRYRIVRRSSRGNGPVRTIHAGKTPIPSFPMAWVAGNRILFEDGNVDSLESVGVRAGKPKPIRFPICTCAPDGFLLSPNREVAAAFWTNFGDPHDEGWVRLLSLKPRRVPAILPTALTAEEPYMTSVYDKVFAFSPDGRQLVFSRTPWDSITPAATGPTAVMAIPLDGGHSVPLAQSGIPGAPLVPNDVQQAQWSPDGRWIAFVQNRDLEMVSTTGSGAPRVLATDFGSCAFPGDGFSWSPTSNVIAYDGCPDQGNPRVMTVRTDGMHFSDLLRNRRLTFVSTYEGRPQWSPDGSRLLFVAHRTGHRRTHVWTIRPDGSGLTLIG